MKAYNAQEGLALKPGAMHTCVVRYVWKIHRVYAELAIDLEGSGPADIESCPKYSACHLQPELSTAMVSNPAHTAPHGGDLQTHKARFIRTFCR